FRRVKLLTLRMIRGSGVKLQREYLATNRQPLRKFGAQIFKQGSGNAADREQMDKVHKGPPAPVLVLALHCRGSRPPIAFQFVVQRYAVNIENVGSPAL